MDFITHGYDSLRDDHGVKIVHDSGIARHRPALERDRGL
jgi:hypothetical protein